MLILQRPVRCVMSALCSLVPASSGGFSHSLSCSMLETPKEPNVRCTCSFVIQLRNDICFFFSVGPYCWSLRDYGLHPQPVSIFSYATAGAGCGFPLSQLLNLYSLQCKIPLSLAGGHTRTWDRVGFWWPRPTKTIPELLNLPGA